MSKGEGKKIAIKFTQPLVGDVSGNSGAFTVSGQEYTYTDGPDNNGVLVNKTYEVESVNTHTTEPNSIQLIMEEQIRNAIGNITVMYNQALGNLSGIGGVVANFTETFTPTDLVEGLTRTDGAYGTHEHIDVSVKGSIDLIEIEKIPTYTTEHIKTSVGGSVQLIHIDDINP